jgi:Zn-finger nucleic acid-binding protein
MHCPRCRVALHTGEAEAITVHACGRCGGVWLDPGNADKLLSWVKVLPAREPHPLGCAQCGQTMQGRHLPEAGVVIDACPDHGVWFDHQELERLAGVVARKRGRPMPALPKPATAGAVLAGVVAASAVSAFALAGGDGPAPTSDDDARHAADVVLEGVIVGPDVVIAGAQLTAEYGDTAVEAGGAVVEAGGAVIEVVSEGGVDFVGGIAEFLGGLLS